VPNPAVDVDDAAAAAAAADAVSVAVSAAVSVDALFIGCFSCFCSWMFLLPLVAMVTALSVFYLVGERRRIYV